MTGIGNDLLYSYASARSAKVPRSVKQVIGAYAAKDDDKKPVANVSKMRRALRTGTKNLASETGTGVIDNMQLYAKALEKQRKSNNNTSLEKKKLKYSFKKISSKIISSKTSTAARQVVSQAKREIQKLKDAKRTGKYDSDEIDAAIDHAKAMERIARKKVRHLEEEEMAKRCSSDSAVTGVDEEAAEREDPVEKECDELRDEVSKIKDSAEKEEYIESEEVTNEMLYEICDEMEEMLDQIEELSDLMDELMENPVDMDAGDIEKLETKHRNKEMKEITKADGDYLKAIFENYERERSATMPTDAGSMSQGAEGNCPQSLDIAL